MDNVNSIVRRTESQIRLSDAGMRYRRSWSPENPSRSMILVHGYAEHSGRYDEMAMHFARRGFAVHAYDQSGHGRSRGPRGHVDRFDRMLDELESFSEFVHDEQSGLPSFLVGHSMGGLVAAATVAFRKPKIDRLILSGALLELAADTSIWKRAATRILAPLGSRVGLSVGLSTEGLSRDPEVGRRYEADPYVKDRMSARFASEMIAMVKRMPEAASKIEIAALLLHGEVDPISPTSGSRTFFEGLPKSILGKSRLHVYPNLRHEIFNEPERRQVWQDIIDWIDDAP